MEFGALLCSCSLNRAKHMVKVLSMLVGITAGILFVIMESCHLGAVWVKPASYKTVFRLQTSSLLFRPHSVSVWAVAKAFGFPPHTHFWNPSIVAPRAHPWEFLEMRYPPTLPELGWPPAMPHPYFLPSSPHSETTLTPCPLPTALFPDRNSRALGCPGPQTDTQACSRHRAL